MVFGAFALILALIACGVAVIGRRFERAREKRRCIEAYGIDAWERQDDELSRARKALEAQAGTPSMYQRLMR